MYKIYGIVHDLIIYLFQCKFYLNVNLYKIFFASHYRRKLPRLSLHCYFIFYFKLGVLVFKLCLKCENLLMAIFYPKEIKRIFSCKLFVFFFQAIVNL